MFKRNGISLIEMLTAIIISSFILLTTNYFLIYFTKNINLNEAQSNIAHEALMVFSSLEKELSKNNPKITISNNSIIISNNVFPITEVIYKNIDYKETIINDKSKLIEIAITIKKGELNKTFKTSYIVKRSLFIAT